MSYNVQGEIIKISEIQKFEKGSGKLTFRIDTREQYNNILEFELFKGADYVEHLDNFSKFNKVGDYVDVEFNLKSNSWTNPKTQEERIFTALSCWKVEKVEGAKHNTPETPKQSQPQIVEEVPF